MTKTPRSRLVRGAAADSHARKLHFAAAAGLALAIALLVQACTTRSVTGIPVVSVEVTPATVQLIAGEQVRFTATVRHENGNVVGGAGVTWSSSPSTVVSVGADGMAVGLHSGSATVTASYQGVTGSAPVVVLSGPILAVSSTSVALAGAIGGAEPNRGVIEITNAGEGSLSGLSAAVQYDAGDPTGWLSPVLTSTTGPATLTLIAAISGLDPGSYGATVALTSNGGDATISVDLTVTSDLPTLRLTPSTLTFDYRNGGAVPAPAHVSVSNSGAGDLGVLSTSVWYQGTGGWLSAALAGSTAPTDLVVSVDPSSLAVGSYKGEVRVAAANGVNSPRSLMVTLNVLPQPSFSVTQTDGSTVVSESGTTDHFTVVLGARPTSNVVFRVSSGDAGEVAVSPTAMTFTPDDWNTPQTATVTGVDDSTTDGDQVTPVTVSVNDAASDDAFDPLPDQGVQVTTTDNDAAGFTIQESGGSTVVSESGTTDDFTVVLDVQPASDVVFLVSLAATDEATVAPSALTFTPANWNAPQTVTVTGVDDGLADGDQITPVTVSVVDASSDNNFDALADKVVNVTTTDDEGAGFSVSPTSLSVPEAVPGNTRTFTVALGSQPSSNVVFTVQSGNTAEATVSPSSLTFTQGNWSTSQSVTVTAVDEHVDDGDQVVTVTVAVDDASSDDAYDPLPDRTVTVTTIDNDSVGFTLAETGGGTVVSEAGTVDAFSVVLTSQPASKVVLAVVSGDTGEATVAPDSVTFTPANWDTLQIVTVTGVDDQLQDGNQVTTVTVSVKDASSDDAFDLLADKTVSVTTVDNDAVGFSVTGGPISVQESGAGSTGSFDVVLAAQPGSNVVFDVSSYDAAVATVSPGTLTFTPGSWSTPQSVTVTGVNDAVVDGTQLTTVTVSVNAAGSDDAFDPLPDEVVNVETLDDDVASFVVSGGPILVNEQAPGNTGVFQVVLGAQPLSNVVLDVSSGDVGEATASPSSLTFTPGNWSTAQQVTVTGVDDPDVDGDVVSSITVSVNAAGSANAFDGLASQTVSVTTADDDAPAGGAGYTVAVPGGSLALNEVAPGNAGQFTVVLDEQPGSNVVFNVTSADALIATTSAATLTFTPANWNVAQAVTVTAVDDVVADGDQNVLVTVAVNDPASDNAFDPLPDETVAVTVHDNEVAGFSFNPGTLIVSEGGTSATFKVVLDARPTSPVDILVSSGDLGEATVSPAKLRFIPGKWSDSLTVTVTGVDDAAVDGDQVFFVNLTVDQATSPPEFHGLSGQVSVTTLDNDAGSFSLNETSLTIGAGATDTGAKGAVGSTRRSVAKTMTVAARRDAFVVAAPTPAVTVAVNAARSEDAGATAARATSVAATDDDGTPQVVPLPTDPSSGGPGRTTDA